MMESKQFQFLAENLPDTIFIYDINNETLSYINRTTFLGYELTELNPTTQIIDYFHPDDFEKVRTEWLSFLAGQQEMGSTEFRMRSRDGKWEWIHSRYTRLVQAEDKIATHISVTANVITSRKEAEQKQRQYAKQLEILYQTNQAILATRDPQEIASITLGYLRQLIECQRVSVSVIEPEIDIVNVIAVDSDLKTYVKPGPRPRRITSVPYLLQERGEPYIVDDITQLKRLSPLHRQLTNEGVRSFVVIPLLIQKELIGTIQIGWSTIAGATAESISIAQQMANSIAIAIYQARLYERAEARTRELEVLAQISTELREMQSVTETLPIILEKATAVIGGVSGSIFLLDAETNDLVARCAYPHDPNMQARRRKWGAGITGRVAATGEVFISQDLMQDTMAHMIVNEVDQLQRVRSCIAVPLRTQKQVIGVMHVGLLERHHFTQAEVQLLTAVSEIAGNSLARSMLFETLETRVADRTQELQAANERLKELDWLKSKFVSDVTHELRTPVTNLGLYLDLLERGEPDKWPQYLKILRQQGVRLNQLIDDTLSLSRLDIHAPETTFDRVDLNLLVRQIVGTHRVAAEAANIELFTALQDALPLVWGNMNQLVQVVTNLIVNAINYTAKGYVQVCTKWDEDQELICLIVKDTGIGIKEEEQQYIFERFYRGTEVSQSNMPGTGLGLAIVNEIVQLHNGTIELKSERHVGSTFHVWLPTQNGKSM